MKLEITLHAYGRITLEIPHVIYIIESKDSELALCINPSPKIYYICEVYGSLASPVFPFSVSVYKGLLLGINENM